MPIVEKNSVLPAGEALAFWIEKKFRKFLVGLNHGQGLRRNG